MKANLIHLLVALALLAACSETADYTSTTLIEALEESSSDIVSSSSVQDSSTAVSSSSDSIPSSSPVSVSSSSKLISSSSITNSFSSSSVARSSSSSILQHSSSSKRHNDLVDSYIPLQNSSSSAGAIPLQAFIDSNETRLVNVRLLYPVEEGKLDTGFFSPGQCIFYEDGRFKCKQQSCIENVGGTICVPYGGNTITVNYQKNDSSAYSRYFHESTETTLLFDVNLGDSAITSYIPYNDIPEFDKAKVKSHLETLSANGCEVLFRYEGYYRLYAEGLPEGIILYHDGSGLNPAEKYSPVPEGYSIPIGTEEHTFEKVTEPYTALSNPETTDSIINEIPGIQSLVSTCEREDGSHCYNGVFDVFSEKKFADYPYYQKDSIEYSTTKNEYGCRVVSHSYYKYDAAGYCHGWELPDLRKRFSSRLINISTKVPATPIQWTLIYKDQYGRGGTVNITSEFK